MFKVSEECKTIPSWFNDFDSKKLIDHPVEKVKYLIWLVQLGALLSVLFSVGMSVVSLFAQSGLGLFTISIALFSVALAQVTILGIHAKSKLAWLMLASTALKSTLSPLFLVGLASFWLLDQDEIVTHFKSAPALLNSDSLTTKLKPLPRVNAREFALRPENPE